MVKWAIYICLFVLAAAVTLFGFGVVSILSTMFFLWIIIPTPLVHGLVIFVTLVLFSILLLVAWRKQSGRLAAVSLGGASIPALMIALLLLGPLLPRSSQRQLQNQREPVASPTGKYVLTVPIERSDRDKGPLGFGMPYWHVTIADPNGRVLYRDPNETFVGIRNIYWVWGEGDRVWLFDSDDGAVYFYEGAGSDWNRQEWGHNRVEQGIAPPAALYPPYVSERPMQNLGTSWD